MNFVINGLVLFILYDKMKKKREKTTEFRSFININVSYFISIILWNGVILGPCATQVKPNKGL